MSLNSYKILNKNHRINYNKIKVNFKYQKIKYQFLK